MTQSISYLLRVVLVASLLISPTWAQNATAPAGNPAPARQRYLSAGQIPDIGKILEPAPVDGDARDTADRAIFRATRASEGSPRWALAARDNDISQSGLLRAFRCSADLNLDAQTTPRTAALLSRVSSESNSSVTALKNAFARKRPFLIDEGNTCISRTGLANSPDYPSGHTIAGWSVGLVLSELLPNRAAEILNRARAIGESRVVCGVHNASAVDAGRIAASTMVAALHTSASFRSDLENAKAELEAVRASAPSTTASDVCTEEARILAVRPY
jgi:acid phosphatase (class A)